MSRIPEVTVIRMDWHADCHICGAATDGFKGIPMYEDLVLQNNYNGEWGGFPACPECFELQGLLREPMTQRRFMQLRGVAEVKHGR